MGENLSLSEFNETQLCIGDELQIGEVILAVSQFRVPCFKLGAKFNRKDMSYGFTQYARTGAYFKVLQTVALQAGDSIEVCYKNPHKVNLKALFEAWFKPKTHSNNALLENALKTDALSDEWRHKITTRLARLN